MYLNSFESKRARKKEVFIMIDTTYLEHGQTRLLYTTKEFEMYHDKQVWVIIEDIMAAQVY